MNKLITLTEFYKEHGYSSMEAVEKAEKQLEREERLRRMDHEEKMRVGAVDYLWTEVKALQLENKGYHKGKETSAELYSREEREGRVRDDPVFTEFLESCWKDGDTKGGGGASLADVWLSSGNPFSAGNVSHFVAPEGAKEADIAERAATETKPVVQATVGTQTHMTRGLQLISSQMSHCSTLPVNVQNVFFPRNQQTDQGHLFNETAAERTLYCEPVGDAYRRTSFLRRKPDLVFYAHPQYRSPHWISFFGNVKPDEGHFTDAMKGELIDFAHDFLTYVQPQRVFLIVFLTNSRGFQFFRVTRQADGHFHTSVSEYFEGEDFTKGWQVMFALMMVDQHLLGFGEMEIADKQVSQLLGAGAHSFVFVEGYQQEGHTHCFKVCLRSCETEANCLTALAAASTLADDRFIPRLVARLQTTKGREVLHLTPIGRKVRAAPDEGADQQNLRGADLAQLVRVVQRIHIAGWAHRDIKPSNVMYVDNHVMLIDFDSAVLLTDPHLTVWKGTKLFFDPQDNDARGSLACATSQALYLCQCDLRCLVRTMFVLNTKVCVSSDQEDVIAAFWKRELSTGLWAEAMKAIDQMSAVGETVPYDTLAKLVGVL